MADSGFKPVTVTEAADVEFTVVRNYLTWRAGYNEHEVDEFLDRVVLTLDQYRRREALIKDLLSMPVLTKTQLVNRIVKVFEEMPAEATGAQV